MNDMLTALLAAGALPQTAFGPSSRYYALPVLEWIASDGTAQRYVARRFIPQPARFAVFATHVVQQGDRIDLLAARYLGDPLLYWRIADANLAVHPTDPLTPASPTSPAPSVTIPFAAVGPGALP